MARKLSSPLSPEDVDWLRQRYPKSYVERMISVQGAEEADAAPEEPENTAPEGSEGSEEPTGQEQAEDAGDGNEGSEEDLIGDLFDPKDHTEAEISEHLKEFPDDKERVLALEREGRNRKGVLAL